ncbi:RYamide receptor isoform X2 [Nomia melanderi]|uniref:RYamide receptor isoform X2 n=1 Tax=Nomia melanderi TaxID=2448451 RepID=UPI0013040EA9|nr:RYamide receptor-like isoform X2 [Nomia melanderi]
MNWNVNAGSYSSIISVHDVAGAIEISFELAEKFQSVGEKDAATNLEEKYMIKEEDHTGSSSQQGRHTFRIEHELRRRQSQPAVSVLVSAYTLVAISIDRYIAIMWPLKPKLSKRQALFLILAVWMLATAISSPIAVVSKLTQPTIQHIVCEHYVCEEVWPSAENRYYYSIALLILQYVIPIMVLMFTYTSIAVVVWGKRPPGEAENVRDQRMARSKRKMVKMMVTVVIVFTICWLPFNILNLIMDNNASLVKWSGLPFLWMALHWLAMSHSCYNPVIYCWMNARFRSSFTVAITRLPGIHRIVRHETQRNDTNNASLVGIPLTGGNGSSYSVLRRMNTCTTYISVRRQTNGSQGGPARSASFRNDSFRPMTQYVQRQLESHSEEHL